jgi:hypothetical protein
MEGLGILLKQYYREDHLKGIEISHQEDSLSYLQFFNDTLFLRNTVQNPEPSRNILMSSCASGMQLNWMNPTSFSLTPYHTTKNFRIPKILSAFTLPRSPLIGKIIRNMGWQELLTKLEK